MVRRSYPACAKHCSTAHPLTPRLPGRLSYRGASFRVQGGLLPLCKSRGLLFCCRNASWLCLISWPLSASEPPTNNAFLHCRTRTAMVRVAPGSFPRPHLSFAPPGAPLPPLAAGCLVPASLAPPFYQHDSRHLTRTIGTLAAGRTTTDRMRCRTNHHQGAWHRHALPGPEPQRV